MFSDASKNLLFESQPKQAAIAALNAVSYLLGGHSRSRYQSDGSHMSAKTS
jgi:hypothetical protein